MDLKISIALFLAYITGWLSRAYDYRSHGAGYTVTIIGAALITWVLSW